MSSLRFQFSSIRFKQTLPASVLSEPAQLNSHMTSLFSFKSARVQLQFNSIQINTLSVKSRHFPGNALVFKQTLLGFRYLQSQFSYAHLRETIPVGVIFNSISIHHHSGNPFSFSSVPFQFSSFLLKQTPLVSILFIVTSIRLYSDKLCIFQLYSFSVQFH